MVGQSRETPCLESTRRRTACWRFLAESCGKSEEGMVSPSRPLACQTHSFNLNDRNDLRRDSGF